MNSLGKAAEARAGDYLIKKGYYYRTGNVPYLKYFLSPRQKLIALTSHFKDKDENVNKIIKFYKLP